MILFSLFEAKFNTGKYNIDYVAFDNWLFD